MRLALLSSSPDRLALSELVRRASAMLLTRIAVILLGLVSTIIISRLLGPEGRGVLALATTVTAIGAQFSNLGFHAVLSQKISQDESLLSPLFGNALFIAFGLCGSGTVLYGVLTQFLPQLTPIHGFTLLFALLAIPFTVMYGYASTMLLALNKSHIINQVELANRFLGLLVILPLLLLGMVNPNTLLLSAITINLVLLIVMTHKLGRQHINRLQISLRLIKENFGYGIRIYAAGLCMYLVLKIDLLMVNAYLGTEAAGYYSLAVNLIDMVYLLPVVVGSLLHPKLSSMRNCVRQWRFTLNVFCIIAGLMLPVCMIAGLFARPMIQIFFGEPFLPSATPFLWLLPAAYALALNTILMNYLASVDAPSVTILAPTIAAIMNIICNSLLIPYYELIGAAIASIISYTLMLSIAMIYCIQTSNGKKNETYIV